MKDNHCIAVVWEYIHTEQGGVCQKPSGGENYLQARTSTFLML